MHSLNLTIIAGNLGRDPELRYTQSGKPVANLRVATTHAWGTGADRKEETTWHAVVLWGPSAEFAAKNATTGDFVRVQGRLSVNEYTDRDGVKRWATEIVASQFDLLGRFEKRSRRDDSHHGPAAAGYSNAG